MQRFRWTAPILVFLVVVATSDAHAERTEQTWPVWWNQPTWWNQPAWGKWCGQATAASKNKAGKEERKTGKICVTHHHRVEWDHGKLIITAGLWRFEGEDKGHFFVTLPPGMRIRPGLRVSMFSQDIWDKLHTQGKVERSEKAGGKNLKFDKTYCLATGCSVTMEVTPAFISDLQTNGGFVVFATTSAGTPVAVAVPLGDFAQALAGPPAEAAGPNPGERLLQCAGAEWSGCSMKPVHKWGR